MCKELHIVYCTCFSLGQDRLLSSMAAYKSARTYMSHTGSDKLLCVAVCCCTEMHTCLARVGSLSSDTKGGRHTSTKDLVNLDRTLKYRSIT